VSEGAGLFDRIEFWDGLADRALWKSTVEQAQPWHPLRRGGSRSSLSPYIKCERPVPPGPLQVVPPGPLVPPWWTRAESRRFDRRGDPSFPPLMFFRPRMRFWSWVWRRAVCPRLQQAPDQQTWRTAHGAGQSFVTPHTECTLRAPFAQNRLFAIEPQNPDSTKISLGEFLTRDGKARSCDARLDPRDRLCWRLRRSRPQVKVRLYVSS